MTVDDEKPSPPVTTVFVSAEATPAPPQKALRVIAVITANFLDNSIPS